MFEYHLSTRFHFLGGATNTRNDQLFGYIGTPYVSDT